MLLLIALFFGLPLVLGWIGLRQYWREREESRRARLEARLEDLLASFDRYVVTGKLMERMLHRLDQWVFASASDPEARLRLLLPRFQRAFPGCFEFTVLDGEGRPLPEFSTGQAPRAVLRRLFLAAHDARGGNPGTWARDEAMMRSFLGPLFPARSFVPSRMLPASTDNRNRLVYLGQPWPRGMLIVRVSQVPGWGRIGIRLHARRLRLPRGMKVRLVDLHRGGGSDLASRNWDGRHLRDRRTLTHRYQVRGDALLPPDKAQERQKALVLGMGLFGWIAISLACWAGFCLGRLPAPSVRAGMIAAFAYSAGIPLLMLGGTARAWLEERRQVLESETHRTIGRAIISFDGRFPGQMQRYAAAMTKRIVAVTCPGDASSERIRRELEGIRRILGWDLCRVYDHRGNAVYNEEADFRSGLIVGAFEMMNGAQAFLLRILQNAGAPADGTSDQSVEQIYGRLLDDLGSIIPLDFSGIEYRAYMHPIYDAEPFPRLMLLLVWTRQRLQGEFLRNELQRFSRQLEHTDLLAWNLENPTLSLPPDYRFEKLAASFQPRVQSRQRESRMRIVRPEGVLLLTGLRGTHLNGYSLLAVTSDRAIRTELDQLAWKLGTAGLLLLLVSVTIGMVVTGTFLEPVGNLAAGIEALAGRRFSNRVPIVARDELGTLSLAFNEMMDGLADLEVARTVQDALFPDGPLALGGWEVFGRCCSASEIGGDYFDYRALDDHRFLLIIGDVAGHGTSAALVMAMAKALTIDAGANVRPLDLLTNLNAVLDRVLRGRGRKTMSCQVGVFDVAGNTLTLCNAGHCYPILLRRGTATRWAIPGRLVGLGKRWLPPTVHEFQLEPDDCLVAFTDALFESPAKPHGLPLGFERLEKALPGLVRERAADTEAAIRAWHSSETVFTKHLDDLTLLVMQRLPLAPGDRS